MKWNQIKSRDVIKIRGKEVFFSLSFILVQRRKNVIIFRSFYRISLLISLEEKEPFALLFTGHFGVLHSLSISHFHALADWVQEKAIPGLTHRREKKLWYKTIGRKAKTKKERDSKR